MYAILVHEVCIITTSL